jgi:serine/threonine protein kinase
LLFALITAKVDLRKHGGRVGDIKPENVFIDSERKAKVVNIYTSSKETTNFEKAKDYENASLDVFLAPEDLAEISKNAIDNKANVQSEIFSIGATVIAAGILDDFKGVYNYKKLLFNHEELKIRTDKWVEHSRYSEIFKSIVLNLVSEVP